MQRSGHEVGARHAEPVRRHHRRGRLALMAQRGSLSGIRSDLGTAFVPLPSRDYRAANLSSADLTNVMLKEYDFRCVNFGGADLRGVRFDVAQASGGWRGCNLTAASLD